MNSLTLAGSIMWILGLAIILASIGWRLWQSRTYLWQLELKSTGIMLDAGGIIFCIGLSLVVAQTWLRILYIILACVFITIFILDLCKTIKARH